MDDLVDGSLFAMSDHNFIVCVLHLLSNAFGILFCCHRCRHHNFDIYCKQPVCRSVQLGFICEVAVD